MRLTLFVAALSALVLGACQTTDVRKAELAPGEGKAAVIMKLDRPVPINQTLDLVGFKADDVDEEGRVKLRNTGADLRLARGSGGYVFTTIDPGTYLVARMSQQDAWFACFQDGTSVVTVEPDTVTYIGVFDPVPNSDQLYAEAQRRGKLRAIPDNPVSLFENIGKPALRTGSDADLAGARDHLADNAPGITLPVVRGEVRDGMTFRTGRNVFGGRICMNGF